MEPGSLSAFENWFRTNSPLLDLEKKLEPAVLSRIIVLKPSLKVPTVFRCEGHEYLKSLIIRETSNIKIEDGVYIAELAITAITTDGRLSVIQDVNLDSIVFLGNLLPRINPAYDHVPLFQVHEIRENSDVTVGPLVLAK